MDKWYISEKNRSDQLKNTAGVKARDDAEYIFKSSGLTPLNIGTCERTDIAKIKKMFWHFKVISLWRDKLKKIKSGDIIFMQIPLGDHSVFLSYVFASLKKRGIKTVALVHDIESFRDILPGAHTPFMMKFRIYMEEKLLKHIDVLIVHNSQMTKVVAQKGFSRKRLVSLEIFDYLVKESKAEIIKDRQKDGPIIIAGSLRRNKSEYVYHLPDNICFSLYGVGYEDTGKDNISYKGVFPPEELPYLMEGSFGLVWDGTSAETCEGIHGEYMRINNPHKTSLYLASGIPIIIWTEAALAEFIVRNKCGFSVSSLKDIPDRIASLSEGEYREMLANAINIGSLLKKGHYLRKAMETSTDIILAEKDKRIREE